MTMSYARVNAIQIFKRKTHKIHMNEGSTRDFLTCSLSTNVFKN